MEAAVGPLNCQGLRAARKPKGHRPGPGSPEEAQQAQAWPKKPRILGKVQERLRSPGGPGEAQERPRELRGPRNGRA